MAKISKYPRASLRELAHITFPLMLTMMTQNLMFFADRFILAKYSTEAMNAAAIAGMVCFVVGYGVIAISSIAEVFVGQYNGSKQYSKVSKPVWQMIWFCLSLFIISIPLTFYGGQYLLNDNLYEPSLEYYQPLMFIMPIPAINVALSAFFIGRGRAFITTKVTIFVNIINIILNYFLVFGVEGFIPSLGIKGAAYATVISELLCMIIFFAIFLNKDNNRKFNTRKYHFNLKIIIKCIKVGGPNAISHVMEISAWTAVMHIFTNKGDEYITIFTIGQNFFVLFTFIAQALQKSVTTIAANLIGSKNEELIPKLLNSSIRLYFVCLCFLATILIVHPDYLALEFLDADSPLIDATTIALRWLWIFLMLDGIQWILAGVLTAGGDTIFIMYANAINAWLIGFTPVYIAVTYYNLPITMIWPVMVIYSSLSVILFLFRYKRRHWIKMNLS